MIATGLDRLLRRPEMLAGRRYALLAHAASVTADLVPAHLALARSAAGPPALLLGPEHGFYGVEEDMAPAADQADPWTGVPIRSLYGDSPASLRPDPEVFANLDLLVIDLQDVGARYYTYAASAIWAAEAALAAGLEVRLLDRPNPLGGVAVEGNLRRAGYESFIGAFELPVRHGLTLGELMRLEATRRGWGEGLEVVALEGWRREMGWSDLGRPWIAPSPNLPRLAAAFIYPGGCLVEATTLSEGRGTTRPFELVGAPGVDAPALAARFAERLAAAGAAGARALPAFFRPRFQKHAGEVCGGVQIVLTDSAAFRPYRAGVELLAAARDVAPTSFAWRTEPYEFESERPAVDLLSGDDRLRQALDGGSAADLEAWIASWPADEARFREARRPALLYPEAPAGGRR